jgi:hypothetical protein
MEHLQICGVLWCVEAQTKTLKRTSIIQNKLPTNDKKTKNIAQIKCFKCHKTCRVQRKQDARKSALGT